MRRTKHTKHISNQFKPMLFNTNTNTNTIYQLNAVATKIGAQIEELQNQLSQVQSQIQAVHSLLNDIRDQFGTSPEAPAPDELQELDADVTRPDLMKEYTVKELRKTIDFLGMKQPSKSAHKTEVVRVFDALTNAQVRNALIGAGMFDYIFDDEVARPNMMVYSIKELRKTIDFLGMKQPSKSAQKVEVIRVFDALTNAQVRNALMGALE